MVSGWVYRNNDLVRHVTLLESFSYVSRFIRENGTRCLYIYINIYEICISAAGCMVNRQPL